APSSARSLSSAGRFSPSQIVSSPRGVMSGPSAKPAGGDLRKGPLAMLKARTVALPRFRLIERGGASGAVVAGLGFALQQQDFALPGQGVARARARDAGADDDDVEVHMWRVSVSEAADGAPRYDGEAARQKDIGEEEPGHQPPGQADRPAALAITQKVAEGHGASPEGERV